MTCNPALRDLCIDITAAFEGNTYARHVDLESVGLLGWRGDWLEKLRKQWCAERGANINTKIYWNGLQDHEHMQDFQRRFARDHFDYTYNRSIAPRGITSAIGTAAIFDSCINFGNNHRLLMRTDQQLGLSQARDIYSYRPRDIRGVIAERDYIKAFTALAYEAVEAAGNPEAVQQRWAWWAAISAAWLGFDEEINIRGHKVAVPPAYQDVPHTPQNAPDGLEVAERHEQAKSAPQGGDSGLLHNPLPFVITQGAIQMSNLKGYPNNDYMRNVAPDLIGKRHLGLDLACALRTPLLALADGVIEFAESGKGPWDSFVILKFVFGGRTLWARYAHVLKDGLLAVGTRVVAGQQIALSGNEEGRFGAHVHLDICTEAMPAAYPSFVCVPADEKRYLDVLPLLSRAA